uniref:Reverse transcriptase zinc-binding domain-containing protein n=1 Tax=Cannabis sativa TaxID=3483 RepID=A0A803QEQ7_CANSA
MYLHISTTDSHFSSFVTVVYAYNDHVGRMELWQDLRGLATNESWLLMGDFNDIIAKDERIRHKVKFHASTDFIDCISHCQLEDVKATGNFFTWTNKQQGDDRIYSKIDRIMANQTWLDKYPTDEASFMNEGLFDHTPAILTLYPQWQGGKKPFRYFRMWKNHPEYEVKLRETWSQRFQGSKMFQLQKQKVSGLNGDSNLTLFHASIKQRIRQNQIFSIEQQDGTRAHEPQQVTNAFVSYYKDLLGIQLEGRRKVSTKIINRGNILSQNQADILTQKFSMEEVKQVVFGIPGNKAPGPDGFSSFFFQDNWELVGEEVYQAVTSFLESGMEYLSRIMGKIGEMQDFKFHHRCAGIKLNHLAFADDVLLFCHGDSKSVCYMLKGLKLFSLTSGLQPNASKSVIYSSNMPKSDLEKIVKASGFTLQQLPFTYLGIPICPKRISGPGLVAWEAICQPKSAGGLGFRNVSAWNKAGMGKYLWAIANKEDSLWLRWINSVYLHNGDWWDHIPPSQSSWYWISLMRLKEQFKIALNGNLVLQKYTVDYGYKLLNPVQEKVFWNKQIWGRLNTPKHSFVAWLAIQHRLKTRDRLCKMGISTDHGCLLCKEQPETSMHLFFESCCFLSAQTSKGVAAMEATIS